MGIKFESENGAMGLIKAFPLPNWKYDKNGINICQHSTRLCRKYCYGNCKYGNYDKPMYVYKVAIENYKQTLKDSFVNDMCKELNNVSEELIRIHSTGEFYDYDYFLKWVEIAKRTPNKIFTSYNKNFEILKRFKDEGREKPKNFNIIISIFPDTYTDYSDTNSGEKYVKDLVDELVDYYDSKKYIVCYVDEFNSKLKKAASNDYFCGMKADLAAVKDDISSDIYSHYFDANQRCDECLKCYLDEKAPAKSNIYCVLRYGGKVLSRE